MSVATIIIPYAQRHEAYLGRAIDSAANQTIRCEVVAEMSPGSPAYVRNYALEISTPFVVWLDADDWLEPDFVEQCLYAYEDMRYVYTGWYMGYQTITPHACKPFMDSHHLVTTLYPTEIFKALGGFDENLPGGEDLDFYLKSIHNGICGVLADKPLLHYTPNGLRSEAYFSNPKYHETQDLIWNRYGGKQVAMGCCGQPGTPAAPDMGEKQEGDVLVEALWAGMRKEVGYATGRIYRSGNGAKLWVNPNDAAAAPRLFRVVPDAKKMSPNRANVLREAGLLED